MADGAFVSASAFSTPPRALREVSQYGSTSTVGSVSSRFHTGVSTRSVSSGQGPARSPRPSNEPLEPLFRGDAVRVTGARPRVTGGTMAPSHWRLPAPLVTSAGRGPRVPWRRHSDLQPQGPQLPVQQSHAPWGTAAPGPLRHQDSQNGDFSNSACHPGSLGGISFIHNDFSSVVIWLP